MSNYLNIVTEEYPISFMGLKKLFPNVSFSKEPNEFGDYRRVKDGPLSTFDGRTQYVTEGAPYLLDENYVRSWVVSDYTEEFITKVKKFGLMDVIENLVTENSRAEKTTKADIKERVNDVLNRFNFIKIVPDEITFLYIHPTRGTEKNIWKRRSRT